MNGLPESEVSSDLIQLIWPYKWMESGGCSRQQRFIQIISLCYLGGLLHWIFFRFCVFVPISRIFTLFMLFVSFLVVGFSRFFSGSCFWEFFLSASLCIKPCIFLLNEYYLFLSAIYTDSCRLCKPNW